MPCLRRAVARAVALLTAYLVLFVVWLGMMTAWDKCNHMWRMGAKHGRACHACLDVAYERVAFKLRSCQGEGGQGMATRKPV
eukprot:14938067-Alexandrium_andersonii.AAC.1